MHCNFHFNVDFSGMDPDPGFRRSGEKFENATRSIKSRQKFSAKDGDDFVATYKREASLGMEELGGNLLHTIVDVVKHNEDTNPADMEFLVRKLVGKYPALLNGWNKEKQNPIFMAIQSGRNKCHQLVAYMVSACMDRSSTSTDYGWCPDEALRRQAQDGKTCLHLAFRENLDSDETLRLLVNNASDRTLAVQEDAGMVKIWQVSTTTERWPADGFNADMVV